jgi:hypothetical protein
LDQHNRVLENLELQLDRLVLEDLVDHLVPENPEGLLDLVNLEDLVVR